MTIRKSFKDNPSGREVAALFEFSGPVAEGKFLIGTHAAQPELAVLVFDASVEFHREILARHPLRPDGGGWLRIDTAAKTVSVYGRSQEFGMETDRQLTRRVLRAAFPDYTLRD